MPDISNNSLDARALPRANQALPRAIRTYRRYHGYDYSRGASLFLTISTEPRGPWFGRVVDANVEHSPLGLQVLESLEALPRFNPGIRLFGHVVMPDHVHFNVHLAAGLPEPLQVLGKAVGRFKSFTSTLARKQFGIPKLWQQGYHDHIASTESFIESTERYIGYNPLKYELMHNRPEFLRIREPLTSERLNPGDYWKGLGNLDLLDANTPVVSLRVSREIASPEAIGEVVRRCRDGVRKGYVFLSGFISKGEQAVRNMLAEEPAARFIHILPSCMPLRYRPDSIYLPAIQQDRFLEIAMGNDEVDFSRGACNSLNDEIVAIAHAGEGFSLYWKAEGPIRRYPAEGARQGDGNP